MYKYEGIEPTIVSTYLHFYLQLWQGWWKDVRMFGMWVMNGSGEERLCVSSQSRCLDSSLGLMAAIPYPRRLLL